MLRGKLHQLQVGIQRSLGFGVMRASAPLRKAPGSGEPIQVRARLESARIQERYSFFQEISQNADIRMDREPDGHIKLVLPYDGDRYFSRQACSDVAHARHLAASPAAEALVGYLALTDFEHANLESLLSQGEVRGSIPIRVPLFVRPSPNEPGPLAADDRACVLSHDYRPDMRQLKVDPVDIEAQLDDPDTARFSLPAEGADFDRERLRIMRHVGFQPELRLRLTVRLDISRTLASKANPAVRQVFISWPTHTSLRSLVLRVGEQPHQLRYNPKREGLEWSDIPMIGDPDSDGGEICTFRSPVMDLSIPQPGELYQNDSLDGQVDVTIDRLLSGMEARLYDATGKLSGHPQVSRQSVVCTSFKLILGDAFARRALTPHQQLHFDEVLPTETRIDDIKTALRNQGFRVLDPWRSHSPGSRWLSAERVEGPDVLRLDLYVEGKQHKSRRERRVPGGMTYRTDLDSGELRIYIYGRLNRDSRLVVQEMNALREALRERFDRLPARR